MGRVFAEELSGGELGLGMVESIRIHLAHNHYPPVPASMVPVCIDAIFAYNQGDGQRLIELPANTSWRGHSSAPAIAIIEAHHLDSWCESEYDEYDDNEGGE